MLTLENRLQKEINISLRAGCIFRMENICKILQPPKVVPRDLHLEPFLALWAPEVTTSAPKSEKRNTVSDAGEEPRTDTPPLQNSWMLSQSQLPPESPKHTGYGRTDL